jgi:hypothetical protein
MEQLLIKYPDIKKYYVDYENLYKTKNSSFLEEFINYDINNQLNIKIISKLNISIFNSKFIFYKEYFLDNKKICRIEFEELLSIENIINNYMDEFKLIIKKFKNNLEIKDILE